jgi:hypothetical protein
MTEYEGKCCTHAQKHHRALGMRPEQWKNDDSYATYENIAASEHHGITMVCKIPNDWVRNPRGDPSGIKRVYQKYHK